MKNICISILILASACATRQLCTSGDLITLDYFTGTSGESLYTAKFEDKAASICSEGFQVLEKSHTPSTVPEPESTHFYWVIRCHKSAQPF